VNAIFKRVTVTLCGIIIVSTYAFNLSSGSSSTRLRPSSPEGTSIGFIDNPSESNKWRNWLNTYIMSSKDAKGNEKLSSIAGVADILKNRNFGDINDQSSGMTLVQLARHNRKPITLRLLLLSGAHNDAPVLNQELTKNISPETDQWLRSLLTTPSPANTTTNASSVITVPNQSSTSNTSNAITVPTHPVGVRTPDFRRPPSLSRQTGPESLKKLKEFHNQDE
jgi:hypothetical protein